MADEQQTVIEPDKENDSLNPPYIPWKAFNGFIGTLKNSHPPDVIDGGMMPSNMSGGLQRQVRSALKFLGLTEGKGKVTPGFVELIAAHGTQSWPAAVKEHVLQAYAGITKDVPIDKATSTQLETAFRTTGANGQVLDKAIRFYLHVLQAADISYSQYLSMRKPARKRPAGERKPKPNSPPAHGETHEASVKNTVDLKGLQKGMHEFPLYFRGKETGKIVVPSNIDADDMALFDATVAVVKAYAAKVAAKV